MVCADESLDVLDRRGVPVAGPQSAGDRSRAAGEVYEYTASISDAPR